jgi:hypothetical protein
MVSSIAGALERVKQELPRVIEGHVGRYLAENPGRRWRRRVLDPLTTTRLFATQVMEGNTAINHLRHLGGPGFTATAYCKARARLPLALLESVRDGVTQQFLRESDDCRWRGHRVWKADATSFSMPDTPELQRHFGQPGAQRPGCGFPVATMLALCNGAGLMTQTLALPLRTHEAAHVADLHEQLQPGDVLVYDRAGCSYAHLALLSRAKLHAVFRLHQRRIVSFRAGRQHAAACAKDRRTRRPTSQWVKRLGKNDQLVRWFKPPAKPRWMSQRRYDALPPSVVVRELRFTVRRTGFRTRTVTLATTLLDEKQYPAGELAEQYLGRWEIEVNFRHLKITMKMEVLKCKSVAGVRKELAMFVLVYNMVRLVMLRAARLQGVPPNRVSFADALRWLRDARGDGPPRLIVNPKRPDRAEPRVRKRRPKQYPLMTRPRHQLRKSLLNTTLAA